MEQNSRRVRLFRNNRNQAVRIPVEFELPGTEATIRREGDRLIIEPLAAVGLVTLLDGWDALKEALPEIEDSPVRPETIF